MIDAPRFGGWTATRIVHVTMRGHSTRVLAGGPGIDYLPSMAVGCGAQIVESKEHAMTLERRIAVAKSVAILGFLTLLSTTYYLRGEVLALNRIRFSADDARAEHELERMRASFPERVERHRVELKNYDLQLEHYKEMLALYESDYEKYVERIEAKYRPPRLPVKPQPPDPPAIRERLAEINTAFRSRKYQYFQVTTVLNWIAWGAALALIGGLLYLLMFDLEGRRWSYVVVLALSFVFLIGPSFHSILSAIVGFLNAPRLM